MLIMIFFGDITPCTCAAKNSRRSVFLFRGKMSSIGIATRRRVGFTSCWHVVLTDARWAMRNKLQWEWGRKLTSWKTSCRRPDAVETQKRVSFMSQKGRRGWDQLDKQEDKMWKKTYALWIIEDVGRSSFFVFAHTKCVSNTALLTHAGHAKKTKEWDGRERIVTLTGWTHRLHKNTKRKCVSILCVPDAR